MRIRYFLILSIVLLCAGGLLYVIFTPAPAPVQSVVKPVNWPLSKS